MSDNCAICQEPLGAEYKEQNAQPMPGSPSSRVSNKICQLACNHFYHAACASRMLDANPKCSLCQAKVEVEPGWHRRLRFVVIGASGFAGFTLASHLTAALVRFPHEAVWSRLRLYHGLPLQFGMAWLSLFGGFALGAEGAVRLARLWNNKTEVEWRYDWKLLVGSWCALWGGIITAQALLGFAVARYNQVPVRNVWVLSERGHLPQVIRHRLEMAITGGNVGGALLGAMGYTYAWHKIDVKSGNSVDGRQRTFWTVATAMACLWATSQLFTIALQEAASVSRRQVWHGFGIAKLFDNHPTLHSRRLALTTGLILTPIALVPSYLLWRGSDPEE